MEARAGSVLVGRGRELGGLERALDAVRDAVPDAANLVKVDLAGLCARAAEAAWNTGAAPRAVELAPAQPPSPERAQVLAMLGNGLLVAWRYDESVAACEQALALARAVGAHRAEVLALRALGAGLADLGRGEEGLAQLWLALRLAEERADPTMAHRAYVTLTDVLTMLGRPRESARLAAAGLEALHRYGLDLTMLVANQVEARAAIGEWDRADRVSATGSAP